MQRLNNKLSERLSVLDFGAIGDGTTDDTSAIQTALNTGKEIYFPKPSSYYKITSALTMSIAGTVVRGEGLPEIRQATSNTGGFIISAINCSVSGVQLTGPQYATQQTGEIAIDAYGADSSNYLTGIDIKDCVITGWGYDGIRLRFVSRFTIDNNKITYIYYAGVLTSSAQYGEIHNNYIYKVVGSVNAYGIALSRTGVASLVTNPRSKYISVTNNIIRDVENWEGLDTHGGEHIVFANNEVYGCARGIHIGQSVVDEVSYYAPLDTIVIGNIFDSNITDGSAGYGIVFVGSQTTPGAQYEYATGCIVGNVVKGYGNSTSSTGCAVYIYATSGLVCCGNTIENPGANGILLAGDNKGILLTSNNIIDPWTNTVAVAEASAIKSNTDYNTGFIANNIFSTGSKTATYIRTYGIRLINACPNTYFNISNNHQTGYGRLYSDSNDAKSMGFTAGSTVSTSGTGEDTLALSQIPANSLSIGSTIKIVAAGTKTGANDNKTIKFYLGTTPITFHAAANNTNDWRFEAIVQLVATDTQWVTWVGYDSGTILQGYDVWTESQAADIPVKITGECANAGDVVSIKLFMIDPLR